MTACLHFLKDEEERRKKDMRGINLPGMKLGGYLMFATYFPQQVVIHLPRMLSSSVMEQITYRKRIMPSTVSALPSPSH